MIALRCAPLVSSLVLALCGSAAAQASYQAYFGYFASGGAWGSRPALAARDYVPHPGGAPVFWGHASSDTGVIRVDGAGTQDGIWNGILDGARALFRVDDLVFGAPPGVTTTTVSLRLTVAKARVSLSTLPARVHLSFSAAVAGIVAGSGSAVIYNSGFSDLQGLFTGLVPGQDLLIVAGPIQVPTNTPVQLQLFAEAAGYGAQGGGGWCRQTLALGHGFTDDFTVFDVPPGITVNSPDAGIVDNRWTPPTEVGFRFCEPLAPHSGGGHARLAATGSSEIAANDLTLVVSGLPTTGTTAFLVNSRSAAVTLTNPGGSDGQLCIASLTMGRHLQQVYMGTGGGFSAPLDLAALPHPGGPTAVLAGETWYWQCWYRDPQAGPGRSNFSAALGVTFE